jgi:hypothetical protein
MSISSYNLNVGHGSYNEIVWYGNIVPEAKQWNVDNEEVQCSAVKLVLANMERVQTKA